MDEIEVKFLAEFGSAIERREVSPEARERYADRVPKRLQEWWDRHGLCGYADGLLWFVDPLDYQPLLDAVLAPTPLAGDDDFCVIARSAFGSLWAWGRETGTLRVNLPHGLIFPDRLPRPRYTAARQETSMEIFFLLLKRRSADFFDEAEELLFRRALRRLGTLSADELYGFEPALALGGAAGLENLRRVSALEHMVILARLAPARVLETPIPR